jgi:class 3 adenylate cyclase
VARPIAVETSVSLPFTPEELWPWVANTARMDRAVGLPEGRFMRMLREEGGEDVEGEYRVLRLPLARWREHPFTWERPRHFAVLREYSSGPLTRFYGGTELTPSATGATTTVRVFAEFTPRSVLLAPLVRFGIAQRSMSRARLQYRQIGEFLAGRALQPYTNPPSLARREPRGEPEPLIARLNAAGVAPEIARPLANWVLTASEEDVAGMRPLELALRWGTDGRATLEAFLQATLAGLLEMRWELLCPSCRGVKATASHLDDLSDSGYCSACNLPFAATVNETIEARFYPLPSIRNADVGIYCVGGPMDTPHRLAQVTIPAGQTHDWHLRLSAGPYAMRSPQSRGVARLAVGEPGDAGAQTSIAVQVTHESMLPEFLSAPAGLLTLHVENASPHTSTVVLDDGRWSRESATPALLMTLPAFRTLFSAEALAPGVELSIARVGLLFTDLAGSTALYEAIGEARAFRLVSAHFDILREAIEGAGGALVKTIGDAVMGAFPDGRAALEGALAIQRDVRTLDTQGLLDAVDTRRLLKVGVHAGPCYAVTLNGRLDYFGTAANVAARAQQTAEGGEIIATAAALADAPEALATLNAFGIPSTSCDMHLRGLTDPVALTRFDCAGVELPVGRLVSAEDRGDFRMDAERG